MRNVICLGDSLTYGFPFGPKASWVELAAKTTGLALVNRGINGETTGDMLSRFVKDVVQRNPSVVVILGGTNDAWFGVPVSETRQNMDAMTEYALTANIRPVIALPPPIYRQLSGSGLEVVAHRLENYREAFRNLIQEQKLVMIDFYTPLMDADTGWGKEAYFYDDAHPSHAGYRKMGETATAFFKKQLHHQ